MKEEKYEELKLLIDSLQYTFNFQKNQIINRRGNAMKSYVANGKTPTVTIYNKQYSLAQFIAIYTGKNIIGKTAVFLDNDNQNLLLSNIKWCTRK